jgi:voltage-gated hydrogen channel 1
VAGFIVDVLLHGILEEAASLVVILRLWRVFKIMEELSVGASEQTENLEHKIEELENENGLLKKEVERMKSSPSVTAT